MRKKRFWHRPFRNIACVYCAVEFGTDIRSTKEHVVGRNFVPKGFLDRQWNLIVRACKACNKQKGGLEDDISAITLLTTQWWGQAEMVDDPAYREEARRKAKSFSAMTGKRVRDSGTSFEVTTEMFPGLSATFQMRGPPQIQLHRAFQLALFHVTAFFYALTYDEQSRRGGYPIGDFFPISGVSHSDWGHVDHRAFMTLVVDWLPRLYVNTAKGHFKLVIRKHPEMVCWSWAVEWNEQYRTIGLWGDPAVCRELVAEFPQIDREFSRIEEGVVVAIIPESRLAQDQDIFFQWNLPGVLPR